MSSEYKLTVGLEIHAELKTKTKMFCNSKNDPEEKRPNVNICPVCMGHPGTLPVINKEAVKHVIKLGLAVGGEIADFTEFDRKNYFYPDIPKGYQISQYKYPLVKGGSVAGVALTRVHLEEDTASSSHDTGDYSLVDFNRAGVPLMELVTEPVIHSAEEASRFAKELQLLLQYLGAGEANLEKGEMRVEANISVSKEDGKFGTKVEVKNLNSFKAVEKAILFEMDRQIELLEGGEKVAQETRGWDEHKEVTFSQRKKEDSHDYRYFPDPDLPKLYISKIPEFSKELLLSTMPELPWQRRERFIKEYGMKIDDAEMFVRLTALGSYFELAVSGFEGDKRLIKLTSNYIISDLMGLIKATGTDVAMALVNLGSKIKASSFANLVKMAGDGKVSSRGAKDILKIMYEEGGTPEEIATREKLFQESNTDALKVIIEKIISDYPDVVVDYKKGKESALQFFVGQGMKATKGSANPSVLKEILLELLK
ncbi:MAG: Asp-tRNA(Asn)/Glu-tRNA(Gln) amidotransferase subunit GatB [Candidatus Paceibacterota bacterium]